MDITTKAMTVEEFDQFVELPENADRLLEFIGGEVIELPSNARVSAYSSLVITKFGIFLDGKELGRVTGEAGGYQVSGERYAPDVAYMSYARQAELDLHGYNHLSPELVVEIDMPLSAASRETLHIKIINYLAAGVVVWVVRPEARIVEVYAPGQPLQIVKPGGVLDGGTVLPGFTLAVDLIFAAR